MIKNEIRKQVRMLRNKLTEEEVLEKSHLICERVRPYIKGRVALYEAYGKEVQLNEVKLNCQLYALPITNDDHTLSFYKIDGTTKFQQTAFGIMEPIEGELLTPDQFDVVLVPLVAFDEDCARLGHGMGFYDRFLQNTKAQTIGIAYELQKVDKIPMDTWDQSLDMIITEKKVYFRK